MDAMGDQQTAKPVPFPAGRLMVVVGLVLLFCGMAMTVLLMPFVEDTLRAAAPAVLAVVVGSAVGATPLLLLPPRPAGQWAMPVLFGGMVRMLVAVGIAAWMWLAADSILGGQPAKLAYWGTFLVCGLAVLAAEALVAIGVTKSEQSEQPTTHGEPAAA